MPATEFPHHSAVLIGDVRFDRNGIGLTGRSINEAALWVLMRPSIFLALATPLPAPRMSLRWLKDQIDVGCAIAPAELRVRVQSAPVALAHEGRHRMTDLLHRLDDRPVPVRISLQHTEESEINHGLIERLRKRMRSQRGREIIEGPLFGEAEIDLGGVRNSGIPPPDYPKCGIPTFAGPDEVFVAPVSENASYKPQMPGNTVLRCRASAASNCIT
jgi:hypothetical protein